MTKYSEFKILVRNLYLHLIAMSLFTAKVTFGILVTQEDPRLLLGGSFKKESFKKESRGAVIHS